MSRAFIHREQKRQWRKPVRWNSYETWRKVRKWIAQEIDCSLYQPKRLRAIWEYHETSANAESCYCAMLHLFCCHEVSIRHAAYWSGNLIVDAIFDTKLYGYRMISEAVGTSNVSNIQGALQWFQIATMWNNNEKLYLVCSTILIHPAETSPFAMSTQMSGSYRSIVWPIFSLS